MRRIRLDVLTRESMIVCIVEANSDAVILPSLIYSHLSKLSRVTFMRSESRSDFKVPSIITTHHDKERYSQAMNAALCRGMVVLRELPHLIRDDMSKMDAIDKCKKQLIDYQIEEVPSNNPLTDADKRFFSGKRAGPDDVAVAVQIANIYGGIYLGNPEWYQRSRRAPLFVPAWNYTHTASREDMQVFRQWAEEAQQEATEPAAKRARV